MSRGRGVEPWSELLREPADQKLQLQPSSAFVVMDIVQAAAVSWHPRASTSSSGSGLNCTRAQVRYAFRGDIGRREISCRLRLSDPRRTAGREQYFASTTRWQKSGAARIVVNSMKTDADEVQKVEEKDEEKGGRSFLTFLCPLLKLLGVSIHFYIHSICISFTLLDFIVGRKLSSATLFFSLWGIWFIGQFP